MVKITKKIASGAPAPEPPGYVRHVSHPLTHNPGSATVYMYICLVLKLRIKICNFYFKFLKHTHSLHTLIHLTISLYIFLLHNVNDSGFVSIKYNILNTRWNLEYMLL